MNKLISELCNLVIGLLGKEVIGKESNVEIKILEIVQHIVISKRSEKSVNSTVA